MVDFPDPDDPTIPSLLPYSILKLTLLSTVFSGQVGYAKVTPMNSISPLIKLSLT